MSYHVKDQLLASEHEGRLPSVHRSHAYLHIYPGAQIAQAPVGMVMVMVMVMALEMVNVSVLGTGDGQMGLRRLLFGLSA